MDIKVVNSFFDAKKFSEDGNMEFAQTFTKTTIMPEFGQIKQYFVEQTINLLYNSIWYDVPMLSGQSFYTYTLGKSDFAIDSLTDEQTNLHLGFINFRYT